MKEENKIHEKKKNKILYLVMLLCIAILASFTFASFVTSPFTGDIKVFIAAENQVKYKEVSGLKAIFEAWELKGIANRLLMYVLYRISCFFVAYGDVIRFEFAVKLIYGITVISFIVLSALLISDKVKVRRQFFLVVYFFVFATYTASQLQAEMTCVVLSVFIVACIVHEKHWSVILAGVLGALLMFFKTVFILLFVVALLMAVLYKGVANISMKNIALAVGVMLVCEMFLIGCLYCYYPQEFKDMLMASEFQNTLFSEGSAVSLYVILERLSSCFVKAVIAIPFLLLGVGCAGILFIQYFKKKEISEIFLLLFAWMLVIDVIVVSNVYFIYHYFLLVLPGVFCLLSALDRMNIRKSFGCGILCAFLLFVFCRIGESIAGRQISVINYSTLLLSIIHIFLLLALAFIKGKENIFRHISIFAMSTICIFLWMNYSSIFALKYENERQMLKISEEICKDVFPEDFEENPVLFLDDGSTPFYVDVQSYSRYFFNLPMQRWRNGDNWEIQKVEYEKIMHYDGKYIVYSDWFGLSKYPDLQEKINTEYEPLENGKIYTFSPDWEFFRLDLTMDVKEIQENSNKYILVRKTEIP